MRNFSLSIRFPHWLTVWLTPSNRNVVYCYKGNCSAITSKLLVNKFENNHLDFFIIPILNNPFYDCDRKKLLFCTFNWFYTKILFGFLAPIFILKISQEGYNNENICGLTPFIYYNPINYQRKIWNINFAYNFSASTFKKKIHNKTFGSMMCMILDLLVPRVKVWVPVDMEQVALPRVVGGVHLVNPEAQ